MRDLKRKARLADRKSQSKSDINVTPLIDIVLVLLIVFIVMVPGLTKANPVVPPEIKPAPPQTPPPDVVVVTVQKDHTYLLQQDKVDLKTMHDKVYDAIKLMRMDDRKVILKVDGDAQFQFAVDALDLIRDAGAQVRKEKGEDLKDRTYDLKIPIMPSKPVV